MSSKRRVFTPEELREMELPTAEAIVIAIEAGDKEKAKKLTRRMYKEALSLHDLYVRWVAALLTFIGKRYGDKILQQALRESCTAWLKSLVDIYSGKDLRRKVKMLSAGFRSHLQPLKIEEDDEKFTLQMLPCGSGGRLILKGAYKPPQNFLVIEKPQPITRNRKNFPVYCAHCTLTDILPIKWTGAPLFITDPPERIGEEPCSIYIYKYPKGTRAHNSP